MEDQFLAAILTKLPPIEMLCAPFSQVMLFSMENCAATLELWPPYAVALVRVTPPTDGNAKFQPMPPALWQPTPEQLNCDESTPLPK